MNPYSIDSRKLKISNEITDERDLLKLKLFGAFRKATAKMTTEDILDRTGLHKSDLSRLRTFGIDRFTIDRLILLLANLGYVTKIEVKPKKAS